MILKADVAQLVEQLIRNEQVIGSSPVIGSSQLKNAFCMLIILYINYLRSNFDYKYPQAETSG